jgi:hypothetical protein
MANSNIRKAQTGEPGNPGQFGTQRHADAVGVSLNEPVTRPVADDARGRGLLRGIRTDLELTHVLWSMRDNGPKRAVTDLTDMTAGAESDADFRRVRALLRSLNTIPESKRRVLLAELDAREGVDAISADIDEYGENSNVFRSLDQIHNDYKLKGADGSWSVMAMGNRGTTLTPHRGPAALDKWYASQIVYGPGRPDAARRAIADYLDMKARREDRPWDHDLAPALHRAKRIRDGYREFDDSHANN